MATRALLVAALVLLLGGGARAGWLQDEVKNAAQGLGQRAVDETADNAYEGAKAGARKVTDRAGEGSQAKEDEPAAEQPTPTRQARGPAEEATEEAKAAPAGRAATAAARGVDRAFRRARRAAGRISDALFAGRGPPASCSPTKFENVLVLHAAGRRVLARPLSNTQQSFLRALGLAPSVFTEAPPARPP